MILNKQYSKDEYFEIKNKIEEQMKKDDTFGQFFPPHLAPFGFNETLGHDYYPVNKEWAKEKGFNWQEKTTGTYGKETILEKDMSKMTEEINDSLISEIFICRDCGKNYRLIQAEIDFYKRMHLPIPHKDFECRHQDRMRKRNPRILWPRSCMCKIAGHLNHKDKNCAEKFETTYSPERAEIIYCENCYQQEVY